MNGVATKSPKRGKEGENFARPLFFLWESLRAGLLPTGRQSDGGRTSQRWGSAFHHPTFSLFHSSSIPLSLFRLRFK